jgi:drug/metabolite transporter (DMT)-like permease
MNTKMTAIEWAMLLSLSVLWGGSFFFNKVALAELSVLAVVFGRVSLAAITLLIVVLILKIRFPKSLSLWGAFLFLGLLNNVLPFGLIVAGQTQIGSGLAAILNGTTPLFAAVLVHLLTKDATERLTVNRIIGIGFGIIGVTIMIGPDIATIGFTGPDVLAQIAILCATLCYGLALVFARRFKQLGTPPMIVATGQVTASSLLLLPVWLFWEQPWNGAFMPASLTIFSILGLSIFSTALAYILYFRILSGAGATNASLVTLLVPVSAILLGAVFLNEKLDMNAYIGITMIGLGLLCLDGRLLYFFRRQKSPAG